MIKTLLKCSGITLVATVVVVSAAIAVLNYQPSVQTLTEIQGKDWHKIAFDDALVSSDGSKSYAEVRRGDTNNLLIFFDGGGACWDFYSCARPMSTQSILSVLMGFKKIYDVGFYIPQHVALPYPLALGKHLAGSGGLDPDNPTNPFSNWTVVRIPYSTADFHTGNAVHTYKDAEGHSIQIRHQGAANARKVLDWVYTNIAQPEKLVVAGSSAGGFGASYWARDIATHYEETPAYLVADAAGVGAGDKKVGPYSALLNSYGARVEKHIFSEERTFLIEDLMLGYSQRPIANLKILQSNTSRDAALSLYYAVLEGLDYREPSAYASSWEAAQAQLLRRVAAALPDYHLFYLSDRPAGSELSIHTLFDNPAFFNATQNGVRYVDWLRSNIIDDVPLSVGTEQLRENAER
ncbi:MAG: pectin acetylesterase-family hydrolase [Pseudomonadota bacterium]